MRKHTCFDVCCFLFVLVFENQTKQQAATITNLTVQQLYNSDTLGPTIDVAEADKRLKRLPLVASPMHHRKRRLARQRFFISHVTCHCFRLHTVNFQYVKHVQKKHVCICRNIFNLRRLEFFGFEFRGSPEIFGFESS